MKKINSALFKKALSKFATGITIITMSQKENFLGKTVNSFASLSLNPPLVLFSLDKKSSSINSYKKSNFFGINILSRKQKNISNHFSKNESDWKKINYFISSKNIPMIEKCIANFYCKKIKILNQGDHIIFICEVRKILINDTSKPLIYFDSKYS